MSAAPTSSANADAASASHDGTTSQSSSRVARLASIFQQAASILQGELLPVPVEQNGNEIRENMTHTIIELEREDGLAASPTPDGTTTSRGGINGDDTAGIDDRRGRPIDFDEDELTSMTMARRLALSLMDKVWYNPSLQPVPEASQPTEEAEHMAPASRLKATADAYPFTVSKREQPSLAKAWAYFEHVALPRFILHPKPPSRPKNIFVRAYRRLFGKANKKLDRAEPGERYLKTQLYRPIFTPHDQLGDWGLGIGLYFSTLRAITILTLCAGLLNIGNIRYFHGDDYSGGQDDVELSFTKGSAICTEENAIWVPCPDCPVDDSNLFASDRLRENVLRENVVNNVTQASMTFVLKNLCDGPTLQQGFINYATVLFIIVGIGGLSLYLNRQEVKYDEDEQTAQDYSIVIENPPHDATDAEEWRSFFLTKFDGAQVTTCTIAVDNDLLVRSLVERREVLRKLEMLVPPGTSLDTLTLAGIAAKQERFRRFWGQVLSMVSPGVPELFARLVVLTSKVQGLSQQDYPASKVFITFETEAAQRRVLSALSVGSLQVSRNKISAVPNPEHLFRGELVLGVNEPHEPNTVRWQDLNEKLKERLKQQAVSTLSTFVAILTIAFIVRAINGVDAGTAAIAIAIFNSIFPMFAKFLCSFEAHCSEGGKQRSLYFKIALFRWVNTAIVITIITPFTSTLSTTGKDGLITKIYAIFFAEIVTTNAIQLADPVGHLQRHFFAPRAKTQDAMNLAMQGQEFELAERYTNMTKILFLAVWYCAVYPGTLFLCSFTLFVNYFTDRFSLMRTWKRAPFLGPEISQFSRTYFFALAILAMAVMSSYYWSGFPFDNMCLKGAPVSPELVGTWIFTEEVKDAVAANPFSTAARVVAEADVETFIVNPDDEAYEFCLQDLFRYGRDERSFPFTSDKQRPGHEWMTADQETLTDIFGWSVVGIMAFILLSFLWDWWDAIMSLFKGSYSPRGDDQGVNFSNVPSISTYVPQVDSPVYAYPLLACNVDGIDPELMDWTDPDRPYSFYDLTKDAEVLLKGMDVSQKVVFSQIVHWPPPEAASPKKD